MTKQLPIDKPVNVIHKQPSPNLHLVKGGAQCNSDGSNQLDEISDHGGSSHPKEATPSFTEMSKSEKSPEHLKALEDVVLLRNGLISATELRKRYVTTYKNWDDMKQRCKGDPLNGKPPIPRAPSFDHFADFLEISGPRPEQSWSVDRIDPTGPYSPDNCRWASKKAQSRNRTNTVYLTSGGVRRPLVECAEINNESADLYRGRKRAGWSDEEIIDGERKTSYATGMTLRPATSRNPFDYTPWPDEHREKLETLYQKNGWRGEHRLVFMERYSQSKMNELSADIEDVSWPNDYEPGIEEVGACIRVTTDYEFWQAIFLVARKKRSTIFRGKLFREMSLPDWVESRLRAYA